MKWMVAIGGLALLISVFAMATGQHDRACRDRGGWPTMIGGYPSCLPPGGKP